MAVFVQTEAGAVKQPKLSAIASPSARYLPDRAAAGLIPRPGVRLSYDAFRSPERPPLTRRVQSVMEQMVTAYCSQNLDELPPHARGIT